MLRLTAAGAGRRRCQPLLHHCRGLAQLPPLEEKDTYTVGFAQTGSNNPWRLGESKSMQDEAARLGYTLVETNANEDTAKQIADVDSLIAQGVDILIFPPRESQALAPSVMKAKAAGIPVILIDRDVDHEIAKPGEDYVTFIGSDFVDQGRRAAEWLVEATGGEAKIIQLEGTTGVRPGDRPQEGVRGLPGRNVPGHADAGRRARRDGDHRLADGRLPARHRPRGDADAAAGASRT